MRFYGFLIFLSFFLASVSLLAQDDEWTNERIAKMESSRFKSTKFSQQKSGNGSSYDWKYAECYWQINPQQKYITGRIVHTIDLLQATDTLFFDLSNALTVNDVSQNGSSLEYLFTDPLTLAVVFPEVMPVGELTLEINYEGIPETNGLLSFTQGFHGPIPAPEIYTLSEPYGARDWWPCKQTLVDKLDSVFVEITVPLGQKAGSNGILLYQTDNGDGTESFGWKHRYPIPAYLISLAVTNYAEFSQIIPFEGEEINVLNYVYPELLEDNVNRSEELPGLMQLYSEKFGIYPYHDEKYGHCQASIPGGMEHSTMSTMANLAFALMAHELGHQWFGNKVTCGSWQDIWLNEGFASYLTGMAYENFRPPSVWTSWKTGLQGSVKSLPGGSIFVNDTTQRDEIFSGRLSYNKGAYVLHMLRLVMGDDGFFTACRNYLHDPELEFGFAYTTDFIGHAEAVYQNSLTEFFDDWYYGEGYPTYYLEWSPSNRGVAFTLQQSTSHPSVDFYEMPVPIKFLGDSRDTIIQVKHNFSGEQFYVEPGFEVIEVQFDPEMWILADNEITFSPNSDIDLNSIHIQPNPATTTIWVSIRNPAFNAERIDVFNAEGKLVYNLTPQGGIRGSFELSVAGFAPGVYSLRLSNSSSARSESFVIVRR